MLAPLGQHPHAGAVAIEEIQPRPHAVGEVENRALPEDFAQTGARCAHSPWKYLRISSSCTATKVLSAAVKVSMLGAKRVV
jgi:hypothetical protein